MKLDRINRIPEEESGAIGIGTLIVFIGLILVAAIASAVIVGVMGDLQERASRTGRETQENVAPPIQVQHAEGQMDGDDIGEVSFVVTIIEGRRLYDLENLMVQINGEDFSERHDYEGNTDGEFTLDTLVGSDPDNELTRDDMVEIEIGNPTADGLADADTNEALTIKFMAAEGAPSTLFETVTPVEYPEDGGSFELP